MTLSCNDAKTVFLRPTVLALAMMAPLAGVTGCNSGFGIKKPEPILVYSDDGQVLPKQPSVGVVPETVAPLIPDAPQPVGFKPVGEACRASVGAGGVRDVYYLFQGRGKIDDVKGMYRRVLPNHGWKYTETVDDPDMTEKALAFEKGSELLYVRTRQDRHKITLILEIKARG